jgi:hypothetical protein
LATIARIASVDHPAELAEVGIAPEATVDAGSLQPGPVELALTAGHRDDEVTDTEGGDLRSRLLDHPDELVSHRRTIGSGLHRVTRMQIAAAHAGPRDAHQRIGRGFDLGLGRVDDADIARPGHVGGLHDSQSTGGSLTWGVTVVPGTGVPPPERLGRAYREGMTSMDVPNLQQDRQVIPKSVTPSRLAENFDVFDFELSAEELEAIDALDTGIRGGPEPEDITGDKFGIKIPEA